MNSSQPFEDERLTAYMDGELTATENATFEQDLDRDPALRAELEQLLSAQAFVGDHLSLAAPPGFLDDVLALTAEEKIVSLAWYRRPFGIPLEGLAVAAAALLVAYVAIPSGSSVPPTDVASGRSVPMQDVRKVPSLQKAVAQSEASVVESEASLKSEQAAWEQKSPPKKMMQKLGNGADSFELPSSKSGADSTEAERAEQDRLQVKKLVKNAKPLFWQVPYSYSIQTENPAVLTQIAALAARYSGEIKNKGADKVELAELSGSDEATVLVKIPASALSDFGRSLKGLGVVREIPDNSMFAGDPVEVRVSVRLVQDVDSLSVPKQRKNATLIE